MNEKEKARWGKIREKGKTKYILIHGIIGWGFITTIAYTVVTFLIDVVSGADLSLLKSLRDFAIALMVFPAIGFWQSLSRWAKNENEYKNNYQ